MLSFFGSNVRQWFPDPAARKMRPPRLGVEWLEPRVLLSSGARDSDASRKPSAAELEFRVDRFEQAAEPGTSTSLPENAEFATALRRGSSETVVIRSSRHDSPQTAQPLPVADAITVRGSLDASSKPDYYALRLNSRTRAVRIDLETTEGIVDPESRHLVVLDSTGHPVPTTVVSRTDSGLTVYFKADSQRPDQVFFLAVGGTLATDVGSTIASYELRIHGIDDRPLAGPSVTAVSATVAPGGATLAIATNAIPDVPLSTDPSGSSAAGQDTAPIGVGQGASSPMPVRLAGPWGGILADREPTLLLDARDAAVVDLDLVDLDVDPARPVSADVLSAGARRDTSVTELSGPGGFPLIGASLPTSAPYDLATGEPPLTQAAEGRGDITGTRLGWQPRRRASAPLGIALAGVLSFSLVLPDLSGAFQSLRARKRPRLRIRSLVLDA
jgi:hypothetical protein